MASDFQSHNTAKGRELVRWALGLLRNYNPEQHRWIGSVEADIYVAGIFIECKAGDGDVKRPGLQRSDNALKAIGEAAIYKHETGGPFVIVTTYGPTPDTLTAAKLQAAADAGLIDDIIVRGNIGDERRLIALCETQTQQAIRKRTA